MIAPSFLFAVLLSLGSAALAIALTKTVMTMFTTQVIDGMVDEEWRDGHGVTLQENVMMGALAALTTFVLSASFGTGIESILFAVFAAFGVSMSYTDLLDHYIFNIVVYPLYVLTAVSLLLYWHVNNLGADFLIGALIGGVVSYVIYLIQWRLSGYRLGFGDVRLSAPIGAIAGAFGAGLPLAAIFAANILALIAIIAAAVMKSKDDESSGQIAFGPFMVFGLVLVLMLRGPIMDWWETNTAAVVWLFSGMPM